MLYSAFVGNLAKNTSKEELRELFSKCGRVRDIYVHFADELPYGYAFIRYGDVSCVMKAVIELNRWPVNGREIKVEIATECRELLTLAAKASKPSSKATIIDSGVRAKIRDACTEFNASLDLSAGVVNPVDSKWVLDRMMTTKPGPVSKLTGSPSPECLASLERMRSKLLSGEYDHTIPSKPHPKASNFFRALKSMTDDINSYLEQHHDLISDALPVGTDSQTLCGRSEHSNKALSPEMPSMSKHSQKSQNSSSDKSQTCMGRKDNTSSQAHVKLKAPDSEQLKQNHILCSKNSHVKVMQSLTDKRNSAENHDHVPLLKAVHENGSHSSDCVEGLVDAAEISGDCLKYRIGKSQPRVVDQKQTFDGFGADTSRKYSQREGPQRAGDATRSQHDSRNPALLSGTGIKLASPSRSLLGPAPSSPSLLGPAPLPMWLRESSPSKPSLLGPAPLRGNVTPSTAPLQHPVMRGDHLSAGVNKLAERYPEHHIEHSYSVQSPSKTVLPRSPVCLQQNVPYRKNQQQQQMANANTVYPWNGPCGSVPGRTERFCMNSAGEDSKESGKPVGFDAVGMPGNEEDEPSTAESCECVPQPSIVIPEKLQGLFEKQGSDLDSKEYITMMKELGKANAKVLFTSRADSLEETFDPISSDPRRWQPVPRPQKLYQCQ